MDQLKPASHPFIFYEEYLGFLLLMWEERSAVEACMKDLRDRYNAFGKRTALLLRPWSRRKGERPYAIYWVKLSRKRRRFDPITLREVADTRPRWFKRLKIRRLRDLDLAIHRAGLDHDRPRIHQYHTEALALNETHRLLARALDSARKTLGGRAAGAGIEVSPAPQDVGPSWLPDEVLALAAPAWRLEYLLQRANGDLALLARIQERQARWVGLRLEFRRNPEQSVGQSAWRDLETRATHSRLNDRAKRKLGLSAEKRKAITPFEVERRRVLASQKAGLSIARTLVAKAEAVLDEARINLEVLKIAPPTREFGF